METKLTGKEIYKGKLINVHQDVIADEKEEICTREFVVKPNVVCIIPILSNKDVILVKQYRYAVGKELVELPAGHIDEGENAYDAARRELEEETGYKAGEMHPLGTYYVSPGFTTEEVSFFLALNLRDMKKQRLDKGEAIEITTKNFDECINDLRQFNCATVVAGLLLAKAYMEKNKILKYRVENGKKVGEYA